MNDVPANAHCAVQWSATGQAPGPVNHASPSAGPDNAHKANPTKGRHSPPKNQTPDGLVPQTVELLCRPLQHTDGVQQTSDGSPHPPPVLSPNQPILPLSSAGIACWANASMGRDGSTQQATQRRGISWMTLWMRSPTASARASCTMSTSLKERAPHSRNAEAGGGRGAIPYWGQGWVLKDVQWRQSTTRVHPTQLLGH